MAAVIHERVRCPRCGARGARELSRLPEEGHGVLMCAFCKHTWCEHGRRSAGAAPGAPFEFPQGERRSASAQGERTSAR